MADKRFIVRRAWGGVHCRANTLKQAKKCSMTVSDPYIPTYIYDKKKGAYIGRTLNGKYKKYKKPKKGLL